MTQGLDLASAARAALRAGALTVASEEASPPQLSASALLA